MSDPEFIGGGRDERLRWLRRRGGLALLVLLAAAGASAEDWPEWRGAGRFGLWNETGVLERFPEGGLKIEWRQPIGAGFSGPAVAGGRVYAMDWKLREGTRGMDGVERAICLDEQTGETLWTYAWDADYAVLMASYATGPRATPTVDGERVYFAGAVGHIVCLNARTGELIWKRDCVAEYGTTIPTWGVASSPLVDGDRLIGVTGGEPDGKVMAFDKATGRELWRALSSEWEMGYGQPIIVEAGGARQLIVWDPLALNSLDPATGKVHWQERWEVGAGMTVATPIRSGPHLLVTQFYRGSMMMELAVDRPAAKVLWVGQSKSELPDKTDGLHALITTPIIEGDYVYGVCSYGELRCLEARTGRRVWESRQMTRQGRWGAAFIVRNGDRWFVNNDLGDLIIARFTPERYVELDRTRLIEPTTSAGYGPRRLFDAQVNWVHPAYANRHIITRNDREILRASLEPAG